MSISRAKACFTGCESFRCGQKALTYRSKTVWCRFADDNCDPGECKFAQCARGKLLPNGLCGLTLRTKSIDLPLESVGQPVKVSGKLAQKLKDREIF